MRASTLLLSLLTAVSAAAFASPVAPGWDEEVQSAVQTQVGLLEIVSVGDGGQLRLNHKFFREFDASDASVVTQWPETGRPRYLLLVFPTDGGSCPELYRILDVNPGGQPRLTASFGNCSHDPTMEMRDVGLTVSFPPFNGSRTNTWQYESQTGRLVSPDKL